MSTDSYSCLCACVDIDECIASPGVCGANKACLDTDGNYTCSCEPGYRRSGQLCIGKSVSFENLLVFYMLTSYRT